MAEQTKIESIVSEQKTRRSAMKTAAQVAVTAPAVGLLLSASTKSASAIPNYVAGDDAHLIINTGDDNSFDSSIGGVTGDDFATF